MKQCPKIPLDLPSEGFEVPLIHFGCPSVDRGKVAGMIDGVAVGVGEGLDEQAGLGLFMPQVVISLQTCLL